MAVGFARIKPGGGKIRTVRGICPGLRLEAKRVGLSMETPTFSFRGAVEKVSGIELEAGLVGREIERAAGCRMNDARNEPWRGGIALCQHEAVIISASTLQLLVCCADIGPDRLRRAEVKRRAGDVGGFAQRYQFGIGRQEAIWSRAWCNPHLSRHGTLESIGRVCVSRESATPSGFSGHCRAP